MLVSGHCTEKCSRPMAEHPIEAAERTGRMRAVGAVGH